MTCKKDNVEQVPNAGRMKMNKKKRKKSEDEVVREMQNRSAVIAILLSIEMDASDVIRKLRLQERIHGEREREQHSTAVSSRTQRRRRGI